MALTESDRKFTGAIAEFYERHLVPLIFAPYAEDLVRRVAEGRPGRVLEVAAGTGVVTRALARTLPEEAEIVATDLNPAMLDHAAAIGTRRPVRFRPADAMALPFPDESFDAVVCQFAAMFFPDRARAYAEARRVLRPGGTFHFSVWDRIEENELADEVTRALAELYPADPPRFLARTPHGYSDVAAIARDLAAAGFAGPPRVETRAERSRAASPREPAVAYCHGTILRNEIAERGALDEATDAAAAAIGKRFGAGPIDAKIQGHVLSVAR